MVFSPTNGFRIGPLHAGRRRRFIPVVGLGLLAVLLLLVYWPGFQGKWFLDDFDNIHLNPNVHAASFSAKDLGPAIYGKDAGRHKIDRPVSYLTLAINYRLGKTDPLGYHIVNFLIHLLTAVALYCLAAITLNLPGLKRRGEIEPHAAALLGAVLWAVHPVQVTAVTYIVQRMAALAALFTIVSMIGFVKGWTAGTSRAKAFGFVLCGISGLLAVGSKQNAVMLPASLWLYHLFFLSDPQSRPGRKRLAVLGAGLALGALLAVYHNVPQTLVDGYAYRPFTLTQRLLTEPRVLLAYLGLIVYPVSAKFTLLHDVTVSTGFWHPCTTVPAIAVLILVTGLAVKFRRKAPLPAFAWLFFLLNHLVEGTVLPLELMFEHRNYLPSVFLFIAGGCGYVKAVNYFASSRVVRPLAIACGVVVLASAAHTTRMRNVLFTDEIAFWSDNVVKSPALHRPRHNLGTAYFAAGQDDLGAAVTRRALKGKPLARINQKYLSHVHLANHALGLGETDRALYHYAEALRLLPGHPESLDGLARAMLRRGDLAAAASANRQALRVAPGKTEFLLTRAMIRLGRGRPEEAARDAMTAWHARKNPALALFLLGEAIRMQGKPKAAAFFFKRSLALRPESAAPMLALVEIADDQKNPALGRALCRRLRQRRPQTTIGRLLAAYRQEYGFLGSGRIEGLAGVVAKTCPDDYPPSLGREME